MSEYRTRPDQTRHQSMLPCAWTTPTFGLREMLAGSCMTLIPVGRHADDRTLAIRATKPDSAEEPETMTRIKELTTLWYSCFISC